MFWIIKKLSKYIIIRKMAPLKVNRVIREKETFDNKETKYYFEVRKNSE